MNFYYDNDGIFNNDKYYTFGLKASFIVSGRPEENFAVAPVPGPEKAKTVYVFSVSQQTYTPANTYTADVQPGDRPFAGWLYGICSVWIVTERTADILEIQAGVVGPSAGGEKIMAWFHRMMGYHKPRGWEHQLRDQPGVNFVYGKKWILNGGGAGEMRSEWIPSATLVIGNVHTYISGSLQWRFGKNIPRDFGHALLLPANEKGISSESAEGRNRGWRLYFYLLGNARYVIRNIFLDGSMLRPGIRADKKILVADFGFGGVAGLGPFEITAGAQLRTKEFVNQPEPHPYASLILSVIF